MRTFTTAILFAVGLGLSPRRSAASGINLQAQTLSQRPPNADRNGTDAALGEPREFTPFDTSFTKLNAEAIEADHEDPLPQATPPITQGPATSRHTHKVRNIIIIVALGAVLLIALAAAAK